MNIEDKIIKYAKKKNKFRTSDLVKALGLSRIYISNTISRMAAQKQLVKAGSGAYVYYSLPEKSEFLYEKIKKRIRNKNLQEHEILESLFAQAPFLSTLKDNVKSIFDYAFSEMLNNAIEHSQSSHIEIEVGKVEGYLMFKIKDFGIGIFRNIMQKKHLGNEIEAIQDLLKGKVTTEPKSHSGEGIFFTSKIADVFTEESLSYLLRIDNEIDDIFVEPGRNLKGTEVTFKINLNSERHLNDVFKAFQSEPGSYAFDKTEISIKLYQMGTVHVSRSQARRVTVGLDKFKKVILDFDQVPTVGQGFADEVFRVYKANHPEVEIKPINMNETVKFMVKRVEKPKR